MNNKRSETMDQEQMEKILEGPEDYDDSKEDSIYSVVEQL